MAPRKMSGEHKAALAKGRTQANAVRAYLEALEANRPKRGRKRTPESIERRLAAIDSEYETAGALTALNLLQERKNWSRSARRRRVLISKVCGRGSCVTRRHTRQRRASRSGRGERSVSPLRYCDKRGSAGLDDGQACEPCPAIMQTAGCVPERYERYSRYGPVGIGSLNMR